MSEIWKDITGYENLYMVSSAGRIKSVDRYVKNRNGVALKKGKILAPAKIDKTQYLKVSLWKNNKQKTFLVHRLVAEAFLEKILKKRKLIILMKIHKTTMLKTLSGVRRAIT